MNLKNYILLTEKKEEEVKQQKQVVFTFGRFQPMTKGHERIVDRVNKEAAKLPHGEAMIYLSQTVDNKGKNPIEWNEKCQLMKKLMPQANIIKDKKIKTAWDVIEKMDDLDVTELYLVVGSDRVEEFTKRWLPYAEKVFEKAGIISAGTRDPDNEKSVSGMSGTRAREAAAANDLVKFKVATGWSGDDAETLMKSVQKGMPRGGDT